jgi:integrase
MKGCLRQRYKGSWSITLDVGYAMDPITGTRTRRQKSITVQGTKRDAEKKLAELLHDVNRQQFVEPSKRMLGEWLDEWLEKSIKPAKAIRTYESYRGVIDRYLKPQLGGIRLQEVKAVDLEHYYHGLAAQRLIRRAVDHGKGLSPASVRQHHNVLHAALQAALLDGLVFRNVAKLVKGKPRMAKSHHEAQTQCWDRREAQAFLSAAKATGPQAAAFYAVALDSGARKAELCGLRWTDLDWTTGVLTIRQQLSRQLPGPAWGPVKNGRPRSVHLSPETVALLRSTMPIRPS